MQGPSWIALFERIPSTLHDTIAILISERDRLPLMITTGLGTNRVGRDFDKDTLYWPHFA